MGVEAGWGMPRETDFLDSNGGIGVDVRARLQFAGALKVLISSWSKLAAQWVILNLYRSWKRFGKWALNWGVKMYFTYI